ncbi:hypothetical protein Q1695_005661 [Nippostrongylus brasiliensis]|nr:hypothetical protein Q1695_005661 [Nippostrongylus brasiliensis]
MGNTHARAECQLKKRLGRQRRLSEPENDFNDNKLRPREMKKSRSGATTPNSSTPPRIQINGMESTEEIEECDSKSRSVILESTSRIRARCLKIALKPNKEHFEDLS